MSRSVRAMTLSVQAAGLQPVSHGLLALYWYNYFFGTSGSGPLCISSECLDRPMQSMWALLSLDSLYRLIIASLLILVMGASLESRIGSAPYFSVLAGNLVAVSVILGNLSPDVCFPGHESLGPVFASMAVLIHGRNPKISSDAYPPSLRTAFPLEYRWFLWVLLALFLLLESGPISLGLYVAGLSVGCTPWLPAIFESLSSRFKVKSDFYSLVRAYILLVSVTMLPFSLSSWDAFPLNGPTILFHRNLIVVDWFSLFVTHFLMLSPFFLFLDINQRMMPLVAALCVLTWIYCAQSDVFVYPGPGLLGLALVVYLSF
jgi:hypothetical protein